MINRPGALRLAYADPPYPGQAARHYSHDPRCAEVDHALLIEHLERDFDGWALSTSAPALRQILPLCPETVRICAWVKPWCSWKPGSRLAYAWEPVLIKPVRARAREIPTTRDFVVANATLGRGLSGVKPAAFCVWLFEAMGAQPGDTLDDLFPGSGAVSEAWVAWLCSQTGRPHPEQGVLA